LFKNPVSDFKLKDYEEESFAEPLLTNEKVSGQQIMDYYHWHRHYEIMRIHEGSYTLINNRTIIRSSRPGIFINRPFTLHNLNSDPSCPYVRSFLNVRRDVVNRFLPEAVDSELFFGANIIYAMPEEDELREIDSYFELAGRVKNDSVSAALIVCALIRRTMQIASDGRGEIISCPFSYIQNVLTYIADKIAEPCSIDDVAGKFGVKRSKFQADFKSVTGVPYHRYLVLLRLTRAKEMLLDGVGIQKTAMETGYASEAHFIKAFREYWGVTPGEMKQR